MNTRVPVPSPGFDELSVEDQIEYVQSLWDRIAARPEQVPVPVWHQQILQERLADCRKNPDDGACWEQVRDEIRKKLSDSVS